MSPTAWRFVAAVAVRSATNCVERPCRFAEGSGKFGPDARRFYAIARGSALECAAILDAFEVLKVVTFSDLAPGRDLLDRIVAKLTVLLRPRANANANANVIADADDRFNRK